MKTVAAAALALAFVLPAALEAEKAKKAARPEEAVCPVCKAVSGKAEPQKVAAQRDYAGETYYFCSQKCKATFEAVPAAYAPPALPRPAPRFEATRLDGGAAKLEDFRGKVVLLDFWATWCLPCVKSMPELQKLHDRLSGEGFTVVGMSIDEGKKAPEKVRDFVAGRGVGYPILIDNGKASAMTAFNVAVVPTMFLIDAQGRIVGQWTGETDLKQVEAEIAKHLRARSTAR